jgi:hypothetical protein
LRKYFDSIDEHFLRKLNRQKTLKRNGARS